LSRHEGGDDVAGPEDSPRRPPPWLPLLSRLTELSSTWGVWKNADKAIAGYGDIDSISPPTDRDALLLAFSSWASTNGMGPQFVCHHLPGSVLGVAVRERKELVELQLSEQAMFRGSTLFTAQDLSPLMMMDERNFRRLRPGSEGLLLLFHNAMKWGGRPALRGEKVERLMELMRDDPEGTEAATHLFGPVQEHAWRLARAALDGRWERASALRVEMWTLARGLRDPHLLVARATYRVGDRRCPLLPVLRRGRRLQGDVDALLARAAQTHRSDSSGSLSA
jgi:hypothetical protein